jgi:DNA-binding HxlR family transcriptional regulator
VNYAIDLIEGRWKMMILYKLEGKVLRFTELKEMIPNISDRVLTRQWKERERDGLITRSVFAAVPVKVVYELTEIGQALSPIWKGLEQWALNHKAKVDLA